MWHEKGFFLLLLFMAIWNSIPHLFTYFFYCISQYLGHRFNASYINVYKFTKLVYNGQPQSQMRKTAESVCILEIKRVNLKSEIHCRIPWKSLSWGWRIYAGSQDMIFKVKVKTDGSSLVKQKPVHPSCRSSRLRAALQWTFHPLGVELLKPRLSFS